MSARGRLLGGWLAVALSTGLSGFWAVWGSIENFHEGWYYRELWRNIGLLLVQYLPWMFVPMLAGLLAVWRRPAGLAAHAALAAGALWMFGVRSPGGRLIAAPVTLLGILYLYGRPHPVKWARRALVVLPLLTAVVAGAYPGWRVLTRPRTVDPSMQWPRAIAPTGSPTTGTCWRCGSRPAPHTRPVGASSCRENGERCAPSQLTVVMLASRRMSARAQWRRLASS